MKETFNARCPSCGKEFFISDNSERETTCPECGEKSSVVQAKKYFSTIHATNENFKEAHGEDYHKLMMILDEAYDYVACADFENAEKKVNEALELTDADYRVYMAMVAVKTRNYTDLKDETHKEYVNKAIALADADEKKEIKKTYRVYYLKRQLSDNELNEYHKEEKSLKKNKLEKDLKALIPTFDIKEKRQKVFLILFPIMFAIGFAASLVFWLTLGSTYACIGFPFIIAGYVFFRLWFLSRDSVTAFNALLDLFDLLDSLAGEVDEKNMIAVYALIQSLCDRFAANDPVISMNGDMLSLIDVFIEINNDKINKFLLANKYFSQYVSDED